MGNLKIFVVEDDLLYATTLTYKLSLNPDYEISHFERGKDFLANLYKKPDIVTLDYSLPDINASEILRQIKQTHPDLPVIIVSGQDDIAIAIELFKAGADDYIVKNQDTHALLWHSVQNLREKVELKEEIEHLKEEISQKYDFSQAIKGNSAIMQKIYGLMEKAVKTNINVSITGETGTGKEVVAKAIHYNSKRKSKPFIAVNVTAIPQELIESELFGHEKGAFTGASSRRLGKFEQAEKGTIFLDEIGDMDINMQAKLLRVLQEKEVTRIGGNENVKIDVRLICATHKNLLEEVQKGNFREDLYFRLLGLPIVLPPLRDRGNDVLLLAKYFLDAFCEENEMSRKTLSKGAKEKLLKYPFPGNVRELKAVIELAAVMANEKEIQATDFVLTEGNDFADFLQEEHTLKDYTRQIVMQYLDKYDNNVLEVARKLDIGKSTIYRMLKEKKLNRYGFI
ncbi:MAG: sigma-54-dependent Fis family transcriptional regulator [Cytophagales bacterium]|nr:sigma-54-dependent Fis family transcriptional regulator [Cytophagales bacterium]